MTDNASDETFVGTDAATARIDQLRARSIPVLDDLSIQKAAQLLAEDPQARARLKAVIDSLNDPNGVISAFQSFASER